MLGVFCANVGNCTALLGGVNGQVLQLTQTHVPNVPAERKRIMSFGGVVKRLTGAKTKYIIKKMLYLYSQTTILNLILTSFFVFVTCVEGIVSLKKMN